MTRAILRIIPSRCLRGSPRNTSSKSLFIRGNLISTAESAINTTATYSPARPLCTAKQCKPCIALPCLGVNSRLRGTTQERRSNHLPPAGCRKEGSQSRRRTSSAQPQLARSGDRHEMAGPRAQAPRQITRLPGLHYLGTTGRMSGLQKGVAILALGTVLASVLFPPWTEMFDHNGEFGAHTSHPVGRHFLFSPPEIRSFAYGVKLDVGSLVLQLVAVGATAGILLICLSTTPLRTNSEAPPPNAWRRKLFRINVGQWFLLAVGGLFLFGMIYSVGVSPLSPQTIIGAIVLITLFIRAGRTDISQ
jgi:hypothetical protein